MGETVFATEGLSVDFGPFRAVDDVSIAVQQGTMTGLIGPNGAGKTTLFNAITGAIHPSAGRVTLRGADVTGLSPERLFAQGMGRTFQIPRPFARMTVLENVMLAPLDQIGERPGGPIFRRNAMRAQEARLRDRAMEVLNFMTLAPLADHPAGKISGGQMKLLELARLLMGDPEMILLDEPAAGVNPSLAGILIEKIEALNRQGKSFVIIEHDMDFVMQHCHPIIALAQGRVVFEGSAAEAQANPVLLDAYLGARADA